jgi:thimet oligopeptidase
MMNAENEKSRFRLQLAYMNRGGAVNTDLLTQAVSVRQELAATLGYSSWADYQIEPRMAKSAATVASFLSGLKDKLAVRNRQDIDQLLAFKKELDPKATVVNQWDQNYLAYQLQKRDYKLDNDQIREYFPADVVISGMFAVYSRMLGVDYKEIPNAKVWAPNVKEYEIHNKKDGALIGYFYTDFFPRPGKYNHAAAFPLNMGRNMPNGKYSLPIAAIVSNLSEPANGKPSLLLHDDVETIFHEFGHIMHATLTKAPYASLSGTSVTMDFVEAPSQMLENWVWDPAIVNELSGHYLDHSKKLPPDLLQKMLSVADFQQGRFYTRQLLLASYDMSLHTQTGTVDVTKTYEDLYRQIVGDEPIQDGHFAGTFGHLMGGYDAGYYGYLWSKVYAQDMFTVFQAGGLTSPVVGAKYRSVILENGDMKDAIDLLREFLGREPNSDAFFKYLHI